MGSLDGVNNRLRRGLRSLHALIALIGLWVALAGPVWVEEEGRTEPGRLAVLVDASKSMDVLKMAFPAHIV